MHSHNFQEDRPSRRLFEDAQDVAALGYEVRPLSTLSKNVPNYVCCKLPPECRFFHIGKTNPLQPLSLICKYTNLVQLF